MDAESLEKYLLECNGSEESFPFGPEARVYKVKGKMFALVSQDPANPQVTFKCLPEDGATLVGQFDSIRPGYYMNKKHWITISLNGELSEAMLFDLADNSYALVVEKLSKKDRDSLQSSAEKT